MNLQMNASPVFEWNYLDRKHRIKINQGGTNSTKTISILQVLFMRAIEKANTRILVVALTKDSLRDGVLTDIDDTVLEVSPWLKLKIKKRSTWQIDFVNGSYIRFRAFDSFEKAKHGKRDILYVNEANKVPYPIYYQLQLRTAKEVFIDYNPSNRFWAHNILQKRADSVTYYSNFTHNPFLDSTIRKEILLTKTTNKEYWNVYGLGKTGIMKEQVFLNGYTVVQSIPQVWRKKGYGKDFGYSSAPTTLVSCTLVNEKDLYLDELYYQEGGTFKYADMTHLARQVGHSNMFQTVADSGHQLSINELESLGWNIDGAKKGANSVAFGLNLMKQYNLFVTARSVNLIEELDQLKWKKLKSGKFSERETEGEDHAIDGVRYWALKNLTPITPINVKYSQ